MTRAAIARLRAFRADDRGNSLVGFAVVFWVLLLLLLGTTALLQMMVVKSSISSGVYDGVQYLVEEGDKKREWWADGQRGPAHDEVQRIVVARVAGQGLLSQFLREGEDASKTRVTITPPDFVRYGRQTPCDGAAGQALAVDSLKFTVTAELDLNPLTRIPFFGNIGPLTLKETSSGYVDCPRWNVPQKRQGCLFPGFCP